MGALYVSIKLLYRRVIPRSLDQFFFNGRSGVSRAILAAKYKLESTAGHNEMYDTEYYKRQEIEMAESSKAIAASLIEHFSPDSVIDVGCGSGAVLNAFRDKGIQGSGLEYSEAALKLCHEKKLEVKQFDIESKHAALMKPAILVLSTEVAEHLPPSCADRYVDLLVGLTRQHIVITAATPGQGGTDHVNEQPNSYWIEKFANRGAQYLGELTNALRNDWSARKVDHHRARNVLVFKLSQKDSAPR